MHFLFIFSTYDGCLLGYNHITSEGPLYTNISPVEDLNYNQKETLFIDFFCLYWGLNSGLPACKVGVVVLELYFQPQVETLLMEI
jgi:hypothetical protein